MKIVFTLLFLPLFYLTSTAQTNCHSVRTGTFRIVNKDYNSETIIVRNKKYQIESNKSTNEKVKLSVTWVNDCTYELKVVKVIKGDISKHPMKPNDKLIIKIISVEKNIVKVEASSTFAPVVLNFDMEILKR